MFDAQTILGTTKVYSPWMPRQGDYIRATLEAVKLTEAGLEVRLFTKSSDDTGAGTEVHSSTKITTSGTTAGQFITQEWGPTTGSGLKDLVRYEFSNTSTTATDWVLFRMLPAVWFDAVEA